jgi:hypothetical protein
MSDQASDGFVPSGPQGPQPTPQQQAESAAYQAQVLGQQPTMNVETPTPGQDFTPRRQDPPAPDVQPTVDGAPNVNEPGAAPEAPPAPGIEVGGRQFASYEEAARHFAIAHEEATRYISQTSKGDRNLEDLEEYDEGGYDEGPQPVQVQIGDPQTVEQALAMAASDEMAQREQGFEWALRMKDQIQPALYHKMVNGYVEAAPSEAMERLNEIQAQRLAQLSQQAQQPLIEARAHEATETAFGHLQNLIGQDELNAWAPQLSAAIARGQILSDQSALNPRAAAMQLQNAYEALKGQQLLADVRAGRITQDAYIGGMQHLAVLGSAPAPAAAPPAAPNGGPPQLAAGLQHTAHLVTDHQAGREAPNPQQQAARAYSARVLAADRGPR